MFEDDQVKHLGIAQDVPNAEDRHIRLVGQPFTLSRTPSRMAARPPEVGEQTDEILAEFGFDTDEIAALRQDKAVLQPALPLDLPSAPIPPPPSTHIHSPT